MSFVLLSGFRLALMCIYFHLPLDMIRGSMSSRNDVLKSFLTV